MEFLGPPRTPQTPERIPGMDLGSPGWILGVPPSGPPLSCGESPESPQKRGIRILGIPRFFLGSQSFMGSQGLWGVSEFWELRDLGEQRPSLGIPPGRKKREILGFEFGCSESIIGGWGLREPRVPTVSPRGVPKATPSCPHSVTTGGPQSHLCPHSLTMGGSPKPPGLWPQKGSVYLSHVPKVSPRGVPKAIASA